MQAMYFNAMTGQEMTARSLQRSCAGEEFDDYIFKAINAPFPFSPVGASSREVTDLWKGRRFQLHYNGKWRQGRICSWKQYNPTPSTMLTEWSVQLELDTVEAGDEVELKLVGTVCEGSSAPHGSVAVSSRGGEDTDGMIIQTGENSSAKFTPRMNLIVNRMNVAHGGTLKLATSKNEQDDEPPLLSLEWLEPPSPYVNLNENIVSFDCPCCRVSEPALEAFADSPTTMNAECPVCLETSQCRKLQCGHGVCHSCWHSCRQAAMRVKTDLSELNQAEVEKEREKRNRLFHKKRGRDGESIETRDEEYARSFVDLANAATDVEGMERLRWELMVENPGLWTIRSVADSYEKLSINGLKVLLHAVETRKDELNNFPGGYASLVFISAFLIAKSYHQVGNFRTAVPWVEIALSHAQKSSEIAGTEGNYRRAFGYALVAYAKADMLTKSLQSYDSCMKMFENFNDGLVESLPGRDIILREMKQWTGSSGQLTRGV